jgi:hypothetical protein
MTTSRPAFTHLRWTVTRNDDGNFDIVDQDGDVQDEAMTLEDAIEACKEQADAAYRERLRTAVENADIENVATNSLKAIVGLLGIDPRTI